MSFQTHVNYNWGVGVEGDFASTNPRASVVVNGHALQVGPEGLVIGRFAWVDADEIIATNKQPCGAGKPSGFVNRNKTAIITGYMASATMTYLPGQPAALMKQGDFWARSSNGGKRGQKVYASTTDGNILCDNAGASHAGYIETDWYCANGAQANELVVISSNAEY